MHKKDYNYTATEVHSLKEINKTREFYKLPLISYRQHPCHKCDGKYHSLYHGSRRQDRFCPRCRNQSYYGV